MFRRMASAATPGAGPLAQSIKRKLEAALTPSALNIINESHLHAGHMGNPDGHPDAETHFKVEVTSPAFEGKTRIQCHRLVYEALEHELKNGVHALSLRTKAA